MYHLIEITNYNDGTAEAKGMYAYATEEEAIANFHTKLGGAMKNDKYESELVVVITNTGAVIKSEYWVRYHGLEEPVEG
jgi:hypothetical protein